MTDYTGGELEIFAHALNWKAYFRTFLLPFGARVLEVGAGLGATTAVLCDGSQSLWLCLEPDAAFVSRLQQQIHAASLPACCLARQGTLAVLSPGDLFDTILYIDVLEHIEADAAELQQAARHLALHGRLIVLSPAAPFLYSPFDRAIGHVRRYNRTMLSAIQLPGCRQARLFHLDSLGLLFSLANRLLLRQDLPTRQQILFWDRRAIPITRVFDRLIGYTFGRSIISVWERIQ